MKMVVYTANWCTFCDKLKGYLKEKGIVFEEINIDESAALASEVFKDYELTTLPQVFIDDKHIGGCDFTIEYLEKLKHNQAQPPTSYKEALLDEELQNGIKKFFESATSLCHGLAVEGGWWNKSEEALAAQKILDRKVVEEGSPLHKILVKQANEQRNPLELLSLIHSEVSEALEGVRKDQMDDKLPHRKMEEVELADVIVRILDYAGGRGLDVGGALVEKLVYNTTREDHKPENRSKEGGKKY